MKTFIMLQNRHLKILASTQSQTLALGFMIVVWHILVLWFELL